MRTAICAHVCVDGCCRTVASTCSGEGCLLQVEPCWCYTKLKPGFTRAASENDGPACNTPGTAWAGCHQISSLFDAVMINNARHFIVRTLIKCLCNPKEVRWNRGLMYEVCLRTKKLLKQLFTLGNVWISTQTYSFQWVVAALGSLALRLCYNEHTQTHTQTPSSLHRGRETETLHLILQRQQNTQASFVSSLIERDSNDTFLPQRCGMGRVSTAKKWV